MVRSDCYSYLNNLQYLKILEKCQTFLLFVVKSVTAITEEQKLVLSPSFKFTTNVDMQNTNRLEYVEKPSCV